MNFSKLILIIVLIAVLVGGVYYFSKSDEPADNTGSMEQEEQIETATPTPETANDAGLAQAFAGGSWKCDVVSSAQVGAGQADSSGTVYISDGKIRADFSSNTEMGNVKSSMIADGGYIYTWSSMIPQGFKAKITEEGEAQEVLFGIQAGAGIEPDSGYQYSCQQASVDASLFAVPADVDFIESWGE